MTRTHTQNELIENAVVDLLFPKLDYSLLNVRYICKEMNIHHSTFYHYYKDTEDLFDKLENRYIDLLKNIFYQESRNIFTRQSIYDYTCFVKENYKAYYVLINRKSFIKKHCDLTINGMNKKQAFHTNLDIDLTVNYLLFGSAGLFGRWISNGFKTDEKEVSELLYEISSRIINNELIE